MLIMYLINMLRYLISTDNWKYELYLGLVTHKVGRKMHILLELLKYIISRGSNQLSIAVYHRIPLSFVWLCMCACGCVCV